MYVCVYMHMHMHTHMDTYTKRSASILGTPATTLVSGRRRRAPEVAGSLRCPNWQAPVGDRHGGVAYSSLVRSRAYCIVGGMRAWRESLFGGK